MFAHDQIAKGVIGDVLHVSVDFGVPIAAVDRISQKEQGGGTILDLGVYAINFVQQAFGNDVPEQILAAGQLNEFGVDLAVSAVLKYSRGRLATLTTHSQVQHTNEGRIVGTKGYIKFAGPFFHVCQSLVINDVPTNFPSHLHQWTTTISMEAQDCATKPTRRDESFWKEASKAT